MAVRRIIPDVYTDYDDGRIGAVAPALANVEAKIGPADGGIPGQVYVLSGPDAKGQAKTVFQGGPLLRAIEEAFDAGSSTIYAWRIGGGTVAELDLLDYLGLPALNLRKLDTAPPSPIEITVARNYQNHNVGIFVIDTGAGRVRKLDHNGNVVVEIDYTAVTTDPRGVTMQFGGTSLSEFRLLGVDPSGTPKLWHFHETSGLIAADTIDLSAAIAAGEEVSGLFMVDANPDDPGDPTFVLTTDKAIYTFTSMDPAPTAAASYTPFSQFGIASPNIQAATISFPLGDLSDFEPDGMYVADPTARKIYRIVFTGGVLETIDLSGITGAESTQGLAFDPLARILYVGVGSGGAAKIVAIDPTNPAPTDADVLFEIAAQGMVTGLAFTPISMDFSATVTIRDTGDGGAPIYTFTGSGAVQLAAAINAGQALVEATALSNNSPAATAEPLYLTSVPGQGGAPTNADYIHGLELTTAYPEISWIHPVNATSQALWVATLTHCRAMLDDFLSERFAILETAPFETTEQPGTAAYIVALQGHVDAIAAQMALIADRNAVVFPGGAEFLDSDGNTYVGSVASACAGVMASLSVQKSLINKQTPSVLKLVPEFTPGHLQQLIQARTNPVRRKPGRGPKEYELDFEVKELNQAVISESVNSERGNLTQLKKFRVGTTEFSDLLDLRDMTVLILYPTKNNAQKAIRFLGFEFTDVEGGFALDDEAITRKLSGIAMDAEGLV